MPKHEPASKEEVQEVQIDRSEEEPPVVNTPKTSPLINFIAQFLIVAVLFFGIGFVVGQKKISVQRGSVIPNITVTNQLSKNQNVDFSLFWNVFDTLPKKYLDKDSVDGQKMLYGAISGMVRSLGDPYTAFLDPKQNESIRSEIAGSYEGIGIQLGFDKDKRLAVIAPLRGTPAEKEGIQAKDLILKIDDKDTFDMTLPEAVDLIRGQAGTNIKMQFLREGADKPYDKTLTRAKIDVKTVNVDYRQSFSANKENKGKQVAVIEVSRFGEKTDEEWDKAVGEVLTRGVSGVIVDMRNNPGGLLSSSLHLAGEFIRGTVVQQEFSDGSKNSLPADHAGRLLKMPMVVLVNGGSASAAEIFSGAMQDNKRAKLVGEKTFGKGTVQDVIELPGGSGLHITIARWLTPKGNSIHHVGITPDIIVERADNEKEQNKDSQLEKALEII
ncbi:MAG: S41 family peptidase [Patescibacteria group bacterium]